MILSLQFGAPPPVDPAIFEREAIVHLDSLYRTARRLTGNEKDAEDLVQETMLRGYRFFHQFQPGTNCRAWLMCILHNVHINSVNRRARSPLTLSMDATEEFMLYGRMADGLDGGAPGPEEQVLSRVWNHEILEALDRLPAEYRNVVVLCDVEELQYKEIAQILNVPIGTVRSRLARGRRLMARFLADFMKSGGGAAAAPNRLRSV